MEKIKKILRQFPRTYTLLHKIYYGILFAAERSFLGTTIHKIRWRRKKDCSLEELMRTVQHPHRPYLVQQLEKWHPFGSALEIGCNAGPNLMLLAKRFPNASFSGVDINRLYIKVGKEGMMKEGLKNVSLAVGSADDLSLFKDQSIDVTFTDATLMYIGPDKIAHTLREMRRVTRKALVFNEWHFDAKDQNYSVWYYLHWVHDFRSLLQQIVPLEKITVTKLPGHLWGKDGWQEYGTLLEVNLS